MELISVEMFRWTIKMIAVNRLIARMLVYSAIKIRANRPALYSTLKPETSSDSPSARSNGVRLVSARLVMNQRTVMGKIKKEMGVMEPVVISVRS